MRKFFVLALLLFATVWANASPPDKTDIQLEDPICFIEDDQPSIFPEGELPGMEQNFPQAVQQASLNPMDYGLVGAMALGVLGLLTIVIKSEKHDRNRLIEAIQHLTTSNNNLANEMRKGFSEMERRIDALEDAVKISVSK